METRDATVRGMTGSRRLPCPDPAVQLEDSRSPPHGSLPQSIDNPSHARRAARPINADTIYKLAVDPDELPPDRVGALATWMREVAKDDVKVIVIRRPGS